MKLLGIETSCDETAVSVIEGNRILAETIASQVALHSEFGGVVPEIASREHLMKINSLLASCLEEAGITADGIDAVAVTSHPGLEGSLLVGKMAARTLAYVKKIPLVEVDHLEAHMFAARFVPVPPPPGIVLLVSGGHTRLVYVKKWGYYKVLGTTLDDAAGESFDKVASVLGLPYPGGPAIEKAALSGERSEYVFPVSRLKNRYDFSYSGIKTSVLYKVRYELDGRLDAAMVNDLAASFQHYACLPLVNNAVRAAEEESADWIFVCGGVAANSYLRYLLGEKASEKGIDVYFPKKKHCTDNASMVASCGLFRLTGDADFEA